MWMIQNFDQVINNQLKIILLFIIACNGINAQNIFIPDSNFKAFLLADTLINKNGDKEIQLQEAHDAIDSLDCSKLNIESLEGIQNFTNLRYLNCAANKIQELDLTQNILLEHLNCLFNNIKSLDLKENRLLKSLDCQSNELKLLDLSKCDSLRSIYCQSNKIERLELANSQKLHLINCSKNKLTYLNVKSGKNENLLYLYSKYNPDLRCIQVDNTWYSTSNWPSKDSSAYYSANCNYVGISKTNSNDYQFFPNPTNKIININGNSLNTHFEIFSCTGKIILSGENQNIIEIEHLQAGHYILQLISYDEIINWKFIKK